MMASDQAQDSTCYLKFVKLHTVMMWGSSDTKNFRKILEQEGDINYKLPNAGLIKSQGWKSIGSTILHLSYHRSDEECMQYFNLLLGHGADITIKNLKGRTVIHEAFDKISNIHWFTDLRQDPCVAPILSTHLRFNVTANPVDPNGLSHFHAACVMNDVKVIELFLNNGVSVEQRVNADSPIFAGYTPLHFAVKFVCSDTVELLLRRGANVQAQDAEKMTPLHAIVEKSVAVSKTLSSGWKADRKLDDCVNVVERIAESAKDINARDHLGFTYLHLLCIFKDSSLLEQHLSEIKDINCAVNADSPVCPGFTPLHFAAMFNLDSVKLLLASGADITIKDGNENKTPLDLCIARYDIEVIHDVLARSTCKDLTLSDGKTMLTDLVISLRNSYGVVNACILKDSPLWSGYSSLHVAIIFLVMCSKTDDEKKKILRNVIERCLKNGTDVSEKGVLDQTPLQFAFRRDQVKVVDLMFKYHRGTSNPVDEGGLSHLHIACAAKNKNVAETLLHHGADVNCRLTSTAKCYVTRKRGMITSTSRVHFCPGSTPLHVAAATGDLEVTKLLLKHGADLQAQDANGMSPVHRLMTSYDNRKLIDELLASDNLRECVADNYGLSHLHVACYFGYSKAVKKLLLETKSQVNRAIFCNTTSKSLFGYQPGLCYVDRYGDPSVDPMAVLVPFDGFTPLRMAMEVYDNYEIVELLLQHGADVLAGSAENLYEVMNPCSRDWSLFAALIRSDEALRQRVFERITGLTDLHLACYECDLRRIEELVAEGANVNARIWDDSPIWSGQTPLHVVMKRIKVTDKADDVLKFLLDKGADVSISDGRYTPLHLADPERFCSTPDQNEGCLNRIFEGPCPDNKRYRQTWHNNSFPLAILMVKSIKDFSSNPTNDQSVSHFHIACDCLEVAAVEGFLKHGVDVNAKVDYFSKVYGGYTPLHVTLIRDAKSPHKKKIIELLLKHGADVQTQSYNGNTPLHYAAMYYKCVGRKIFEMIFDAGANINAKNVKGESPLEMLSKEGHATFSKISYFMKRNCRINDFNSATDEGLMAVIIESADQHQREKIKKLLLTSPDIVDVDEMGRNAIHNVASIRSSWISEGEYIDLIERLEKLGCDVDHQDKSEQTALHAAARFQNHQAISALLATGVDINIIDAIGKTAFDYSLIPRKEYNDDRDTFDDIFNGDAIKLFATHLNKLRIAGLHVNSLNENSKKIAHEKHYRYIGVMMDERRFHAILQRIDNAKAECYSLGLRDFMSKNGAVWEYSKMKRMDYENVLEIFDTILDKRYEEKLSELRCLVKLQYRNYIMRSRLVEDAKIALDTLANIPMPELCSEAIFGRFENWELRNVIMSAC